MLQVVKLTNELVEKKLAVQFMKDAWKHGGFAQGEDQINRIEDLMECFYVLLQDQQIIGCCGLVEKNSLMNASVGPWMMSLYVDEHYRGHNYGQLLINHVLHQAYLQGHSKIYLVTNSGDYYQKQGWTIFDGSLNKVNQQMYVKELTERC